MTQKSDDDEASFEGLVSFDTVPPPPGVSGEGGDDVHNARTTVAELPDSFLDSLKVKAADAAAAYASRPVAPEPELFAKRSSVIVDFSTDPSDLEAAFASALETPPPATESSAPRYQQPYPSPMRAFAPHHIATPPPYVAPGQAPLSSIPPREPLVERLRAAGWRGVVLALIALLVGFSVALWLRVLLGHYLG